jgi:hypothetical protein
MNNIEARVFNLPRWAQDYIKQLEMEVQRLKDVIALSNIARGKQ